MLSLPQICGKYLTATVKDVYGDVLTGVKVTIKLDNALLSKYENLVAYAPDASGAMVVLSGAEIVDGNLVDSECLCSLSVSSLNLESDP